MGTTESVFYNDANHDAATSTTTTAAAEQQQLPQQRQQVQQRSVIVGPNGQRDPRHYRRHNSDSTTTTATSHTNKNDLRRRRLSSNDNPKAATATAITTANYNQQCFELNGVIIGLENSGKETLLQRFEGKVPNDFSSATTTANASCSTSGSSITTGKRTRSITIPYIVPTNASKWDEQILLHIESMIKLPTNKDSKKKKKDKKKGIPQNQEVDEEVIQQKQQEQKQQEERKQEEKLFDFVLLMIDPRYPNPKKMQKYITKTLRQFMECYFSGENANNANTTSENSKPFCLCILRSFRDAISSHDSDDDDATIISQSDLTYWTMSVLQDYYDNNSNSADTKTHRIVLDPSRTILKCHDVSLLNCYGLLQLHHFIYDVYIQYKLYDYYNRIDRIQQQQQQFQEQQQQHQSYEEYCQQIQSLSTPTTAKPKIIRTKASQRPQNNRVAESLDAFLASDSETENAKTGKNAKSPIPKHSTTTATTTTSTSATLHVSTNSADPAEEPAIVVASSVPAASAALNVDNINNDDDNDDQANIGTNDIHQEQNDGDDDNDEHRVFQPLCRKNSTQNWNDDDDDDDDDDDCFYYDESGIRQQQSKNSTNTKKDKLVLIKNDVCVKSSSAMIKAAKVTSIETNQNASTGHESNNTLDDMGDDCNDRSKTNHSNGTNLGSKQDHHPNDIMHDHKDENFETKQQAVATTGCSSSDDNDESKQISIETSNDSCSDNNDCRTILEGGNQIDPARELESSSTVRITYNNSNPSENSESRDSNDDTEDHQNIKPIICSSQNDNNDTENVIQESDPPPLNCDATVSTDMNWNQSGGTVAAKEDDKTSVSSAAASNVDNTNTVDEFVIGPNRAIDESFFDDDDDEKVEVKMPLTAMQQTNLPAGRTTSHDDDSDDDDEFFVDVNDCSSLTQQQQQPESASVIQASKSECTNECDTNISMVVKSNQGNDKSAITTTSIPSTARHDSPSSIGKSTYDALEVSEMNPSTSVTAKKSSSSNNVIVLSAAAQAAIEAARNEAAIILQQKQLERREQNEPKEHVTKTMTHVTKTMNDEVVGDVSDDNERNGDVTKDNQMIR